MRKREGSSPSSRTNLKRPLLKYTYNRAPNPLEIIGFSYLFSFLLIRTHSYPLLAIPSHTILQLSYNFKKATFRAFLTFQKVLRNSSPTFSTIITSNLTKIIALQKQLARHLHVHFSGENMTTEAQKKKLKDELKNLQLELIAAACDQEKRRLSRMIKSRAETLAVLGG